MNDGDRVETQNSFLYRAEGKSSGPLMRKLISNVWGGDWSLFIVVVCLGKPRLLPG